MIDILLLRYAIIVLDIRKLLLVYHTVYDISSLNVKPFNEKTYPSKKCRNKDIEKYK